ncbi:MAG: (Fe-S)-binding protein, partial [Bryobacteraceae bacterium]
TLKVVRPHLESGTPIVGLEPSCVAVFRDELTDLFPHDEDAKRLHRQMFTLAEFLEKKAPDFRPPKLARQALVHGHCHQTAVLGMDAETEQLGKLGLEVQLLDEGCCGMAGSFGFIEDKYELSQKIGELGVLPAVRGAPKDSFVIADGFSCRTQIEQGTDRQALHTAQVIQLALQQTQNPVRGDYPERGRVPLRRNDGHARELAVAGCGLALGGWLAWRMLKRTHRRAHK